MYLYTWYLTHITVRGRAEQQRAANIVESIAATELPSMSSGDSNDSIVAHLNTAH